MNDKKKLTKYKENAHNCKELKDKIVLIKTLLYEYSYY